MARDRSHSIWPGADRSVMVQTDYCEAEAQTDLYTPEYVVLPGSQQKPQRITSNNNNGVEQYHVHVHVAEGQVRRVSWQERGTEGEM